MKRLTIIILMMTLTITACLPKTSNSIIPSEAEIAITAEADLADQTAQEQSNAFRVQDALGREVEFEQLPERIVVSGKLRPMIVDFLYLFESSARKILAIEAGGQASENFIELIDATIKEKYTLEKGAGAEQIAPLGPDLVIMKTSMRETVGEQLEKINIPVVYVDFETIESTYRDIILLGELLGEGERALEIVRHYQEVYESLQSNLAAENGSAQVLMLQVTDGEQKYAFNVPSAAFLQTALVEAAGGSAVWKEATPAGGWSEVNLEQVTAWDAEHIFIINYQGKAGQIIEALAQEETFRSLKAWKNGQVKAFPFDYISWDQPDTRWLLGYAWLVYELNLDALTDQEMRDIVVDFYHFFYGLDEEEILTTIIPKVEKYFQE